MTATIQHQTFNGHRIATAFHDAGGKKIVIFCHGFHSSNVGPSRMFVTVAQELEAKGISSLRFDQYGSGNSEGDFFDSSFEDWTATTRAIARHYLGAGYRVALFGQSMGATTAVVVASELPELVAVVAWALGASVDEFVAPASGVIEEDGQIVQARYWQEAHDADVAAKLRLMQAPMFAVQGTADAFSDERSRAAIAANAQPQHRVETFEGLAHSRWTHEQSTEIINKSMELLVASFGD